MPPIKPGLYWVELYNEKNEKEYIEAIIPACPFSYWFPDQLTWDSADQSAINFTLSTTAPVPSGINRGRILVEFTTHNEL